MVTPFAEKAYEKYAWVFLLVLSIIGMAFGILGFAGLPIFGPDINTEAQQIAGMLMLGLSIFSIAVVLRPYRMGERWAWYVLWYLVMPSVFFIYLGGPLVLNGPLLVLALLGLLLPVRKFFPKQ